VPEIPQECLEVRKVDAVVTVDDVDPYLVHVLVYIDLYGT
jgi:hypothetical protein